MAGSGSMSALIIDGRATAAQIRSELRAQLLQGTITPGLAVVMAGEHPASAVYVAGKIKACAEVGIASQVHHLGAHSTEHEIFAIIDALNENPNVHGILVQMPLPDHLDSFAILSRVDPAKDVDGLHPTNLGKLMSGQPGLRPCTPMGVMRLLHVVQPELTGLHAVVIGRSVLVGKPMAQMLLLDGCTVMMCHSRTRDLATLTRQADILIAATGQPGLVTQDMVKPGAIVIDVGITRHDGRLVGDVDFVGVSRVAHAITPVPGGVGPMTVASLLMNTVSAATSPARG